MPIQSITCNVCGIIFQAKLRAHRRFCSRACSAKGMTRHGPTTTVEERFWKKVNIINDSTSCWEWTAGTRGRRGHYGVFSITHTQMIYAHRMSYIINSGPIPLGLFVCHHCDRPLCVRPAHLFLGTHIDNMADAKIKGLWKGKGGAKGSKHGKTKLTEDDIIKARRLHSAGDLRCCDLADSFGISHGAMSHILTRRTWRHI